ncbi:MULTISPECIES: hypothetical protein [Maribacter]|uniref:LPXTG-motif cell wall anchor domain-containing protein n=1 Tax=Maribacter arenosus TaxID=1854708 RepID=A0ABR7VH94_9FLAO|nr:MULTISPECIES: hypothetical protein [Maribacter]MBD0851907.1 hypothetical protein [Maribacter arenosus]
MNRELSAILTSVALILFLIVSIWLFRYFKTKKKAKAGDAKDRSFEK